MKKVSLLLILLCSISVRAMDDGKTVVAVELDGIVSNQDEVGVSDFKGMAKHPSLWLSGAYLLRHAFDLEKDFRDIEGSTHGIANVFYGLVESINKKYKVDLSEYTSDLVNRFTKPVPNSNVIDLLRRIREQGDIVMGVTDYDYYHFRAYRAEMENKGVDLKDLLSGIVVTRFNYLENGSSPLENKLWDEPEKGVYMALDAEAVTPKKEKRGYALKTGKYFDVVRKASQDIKPSAQQFIHVDPSIECVAVAQEQPNFKGIHFSGSCDQLKKALSE